MSKKQNWLFVYGGGPDIFVRCTLDDALLNIAKTNNINYVSFAVNVRLDELLAGFQSSLDIDVLFMMQDGPTIINAPLYDRIKNKYPNAKFVCFCCDIMYDGYDTIKWPFDLLMCTTKESKKDLSYKFNSEFFYWNISETTIKKYRRLIF